MHIIAKHPDVAVDDNNVHHGWVLLGFGEKPPVTWTPELGRCLSWFAPMSDDIWAK